jgi:hypothetical protein
MSNNARYNTKVSTNNEITQIMQNPRDFLFSKKSAIYNTFELKIQYIQALYFHVQNGFDITVQYICKWTSYNILMLYRLMYFQSFQFIKIIYETIPKEEIKVDKSTYRKFLLFMEKFQYIYERDRDYIWSSFLCKKYNHLDKHIINHIESFL